MKKLITLLIVLICCVCTLGAKTIYFVNNFNNINSLKLYLYTGTTNNGWPGTDFPEKESYSIDGYDVYKLDLGDYENFIVTFKFNDNNEWQRESQVALSNNYSEGATIDFSSDWKDDKVALTSALTVYTYDFTVTTADNFDVLKIYLFNNTVPINGDWGSAPSMSVSDKVYTYTYKTFNNSGAEIGVIFRTSYDQTEDLTANVGDNTYYLKYVNTETKKLREAEIVSTNTYGYATFVNTKSLNISDATAYYATDNNNGSATAIAITNPAASTPMLIKGDASTTYYFAVAASGTDYSSTNAFHAGSGSALGANDGLGVNYILKGDAFYKANGNVVATNKAYLKLSQEASARALIFPGDDDETTAIENMKATTVDSNAPIYNIAGQRVAKDYRGIVIQNGRKFINK